MDELNALMGNLSVSTRARAKIEIPSIAQGTNKERAVTAKDSQTHTAFTGETSRTLRALTGVAAEVQTPPPAAKSEVEEQR